MNWPSQRDSKADISSVTTFVRANRIYSDEGLMLKTSAFKSLYSGQFTLSMQLIKPNYLVIHPTDAAPVSFETYPLYSSASVKFGGFLVDVYCF